MLLFERLYSSGARRSVSTDIWQCQERTAAGTVESHVASRPSSTNGLQQKSRSSGSLFSGFRGYPPDPASTYILLTVTDTGQGISDKDLPRIFEPFYTTKPAGSGTGLGLTVVYGIICQSDGLISAHSEPGKGSTFKIYLPVVAPPIGEFASPHPASKPVHGESETLLVVEDEDAVRQSEIEFLSAH